MEKHQMASIWNRRRKQILFFNLNTKATTLKGKKIQFFMLEPGLDLKKKKKKMLPSLTPPSVCNTTSHLLSSTQLIAEQTKVG